jgi:hypothetical protein
MLGRSDADAAVLGELSVAAVWRLRGVSRAFRGWCGSALAAMPRVVAVGGMQSIGGMVTLLATAVSLDLATLAWGGGGTDVPDLPAPCESFSLGQLPGGRLVAAGGTADGTTATAAAFEWVPGRAAWTPLPAMGTARANAAAAVLLSDGRLLVAGGFEDDGQDLASVEVLAADGSGWAALAPMATARYGAVAGRLPGGQVIVAGGAAGDGDGDGDDEDWTGHEVLASAELWDPATGAWAALPPMAQARHRAACCVLPSGRFAVLGGSGEDDAHRADAEAFDPVSRAWQPLPPMPDRLVLGRVAVAVAGGLLAITSARCCSTGGVGDTDSMLFDEESGRWFTLPGQMPAGRAGHRLMTIPAPWPAGGESSERWG